MIAHPSVVNLKRRSKNPERIFQAILLQFREGTVLVIVMNSVSEVRT